MYSVYRVNGVLYCLGVVSHTGHVQSIGAHRVQNYNIIINYLEQHLGIIPEFDISIGVGYGIVEF